MAGNECKTVLVVDDDDGILETICEILQDEGYTVACVHNGERALDWLRTAGQGSGPCLILLDLMMPVMDGFRFREIQKEDPSFKAIPVVVISAHARKDQVDADAFLSKPIDLQQLISTVQQYCCA
jgi:CheY-like chemotaxis protein